MFSILLLLAIGILAGVVAWMLVPGHSKQGWINPALLGVFGAVCGDFVGSLFGLHTGHPAAYGFALLGAALVAGGYHWHARRRPADLTFRTPGPPL